MKLAIRDKWLDEILAGRKRFELRDAHLTLVGEKSKRTVTVDVSSSRIIRKDISKRFLNPIEDEEFDSMFDDEYQILFTIEKRGGDESLN